MDIKVKRYIEEVVTIEGSSFTEVVDKVKEYMEKGYKPIIVNRKNDDDNVWVGGATKRELDNVNEDISVEDKYKYHVLIRAKNDNRVVWSFTKRAVSKSYADKIAEDNNRDEDFNLDYYYISIEKE